MKRLTIILFALILSVSIHADLLTDIVDGKYKPQMLPAYTHLSDGEHYALQEGNLILAYDYRTGTVSDTLFNLARCKAKKGETLPKLDTIEGFILSPDEQTILVYNHKEQIFRRSYCAEYYLYKRDKQTLTHLTEGKIREVVFSPNSKYIAFTRERNIFIYKADFGTEVAVTTDGKANFLTNGASDWLYEEEFGITGQLAFSPDNTQLAFVRLNETEVPEFMWQKQLQKEGTKGGKDYPFSAAVSTLKYPRAGQPIAKASAVVYDIQAKSLKTMQLPEVAERYIPRIRWASATELAIFTLNRFQNTMEMYYANPKSTLCQPIYREENKHGWVDYALIDEWQFLPSGNILLVNEISGYKQCYLYSHLGQLRKALTGGNEEKTKGQSVQQSDPFSAAVPTLTSVLGYDEKSQILYFEAASHNPTTRYIYALNTKNNKIQCLTNELGTHHASFSVGYKYLIDHYSTSTVADEYNLKTNTGKLIRNLLSNKSLTQSFAALNLPEKQFFEFITERGDTLSAWIIYPVGFDEKKQYPVLQVQYSGPDSQQVLDRWRIDWEYYWATQGVIVVCVDPRGTACRGRAFKELTYCQLGTLEAQDQVSMAHYMQRQPFVKADKIAIWGWSYGGFMVLRSMAADSVFSCGIAVAPVTDWALYDAAYTERYMRTPGANEAGYAGAQLSAMASQLQGRLLIVHGLADDNVHCQHTWQYIDALVQANKQFEMQIYPDDNHFLRKRNNYKHLYQRMTIFLKNNLLTE